MRTLMMNVIKVVQRHVMMVALIVMMVAPPLALTVAPVANKTGSIN
jgi:hypothetical protein